MKYYYKQIKENKDILKIVNKVFHDLESTQYQNTHPEIYKREFVKWQNIFDQYVKVIKQREPLVILDIGSGVGFVPSVFSKYLGKDDEFIFTDISPNMVDVCRKLFNDLLCKKDFLVLDSSKVDILSDVNVITVNSVLHHIPDNDIFLSKIDTVLKPGGVIIIRHEPNCLFANFFIFRIIFRVIKFLKNRKSIKLDKKLNGLHKDCVDVLRDECQIEFLENQTNESIQALVDIESPTAAGDLDKNKGFNPWLIKDKYFKNYDVLSLRTYSFLGKVDEDRGVFRIFISRSLKFLFPKRGYMFEMVLKKGSSNKDFYKQHADKIIEKRSQSPYCLRRYAHQRQYQSILNNVQPGTTVLDAGCGEGVLAIMMAKKGAKVSACDISEPNIMAAKQAAQEAGVEINFFQADSEKIDLPDNSFDLVVSSHVLEHLDDFDQGLRELMRLTKKMAVVAIPTILNFCSMVQVGGGNYYYRGKRAIYAFWFGLLRTFLALVFFREGVNESYAGQKHLPHIFRFPWIMKNKIKKYHYHLVSYEASTLCWPHFNFLLPLIKKLDKLSAKRFWHNFGYGTTYVIEKD